MKSLWLEQNTLYDGKQLQPLMNYLVHGLLGDSIVAWRGPCNVSAEHMIDGEDLRQEALIQGQDMLHFVVEIFDFSLRAGIALQRLMATLVVDTLKECSTSDNIQQLKRSGDDLYLSDKKLNISIATATTNSVLIHFGVNVTNEGTPVATCSLKDFNVEPEKFAGLFLDKVTEEVKSIHRANQKVRVF